MRNKFCRELAVFEHPGPEKEKGVKHQRSDRVEAWRGANLDPRCVINAAFEVLVS